MDLVPDGDLIEVFVRQGQDVEKFIGGLADDVAMARYQPEKWSIREVFGHLIDTERVMAYRLLCAARGDETPMPSFDEEAYVRAAQHHQCSIAALALQWKVARESTLSILSSLSATEFHNRGSFKGRPQTALTVACVIVGHVNHHLNILRERYGVGLVGER